MSEQPTYTLYKVSTFVNAELEARGLAPIKSQMLYSYANAKKPLIHVIETDEGLRVTHEEAERFVTVFVKNRINSTTAGTKVTRLEGLQIDEDQEPFGHEVTEDEHFEDA